MSDDLEYLRKLDTAMADESGKLRDGILQALTALDIAFRPGAVRSDQREWAAFDIYIEPLKKRANSFGAAAFFTFGFGVSPNLRWAGIAKAHLDTAKELEAQWQKLRLESIWDEYTVQAGIIRRMERQIAAQEQGLIATTLSYVDKAALGGIQLARDLGRGVKEITGQTLSVAEVALHEVGETSRTGIETIGEVTETGIEVTGDTIQDLGEKAASTVKAGLAIWGVVAAVAVVVVILVFAPAVKAYIPKGGAR